MTGCQVALEPQSFTDRVFSSTRRVQRASWRRSLSAVNIVPVSTLYKPLLQTRRKTYRQLRTLTLTRAIHDKNNVVSLVICTLEPYTRPSQRKSVCASRQPDCTSECPDIRLTPTKDLYLPNTSSVDDSTEPCSISQILSAWSYQFHRRLELYIPST